MVAFPSHLTEHRKGPPVENRNESSLFTLDEFNTEGVNSMRTQEKRRKGYTLNEHQRKWDKDRDTKPHRQTKADTEVEVGFLWPLLEAHLGWGVLLWQDASVPSVSLFKSPKQGADVSHGPSLPLFSLGTPLNRWGSQQVQESAQMPLFFLPASLYVYSATRLPFPCPSVLHALLCCLKLSSQIKPNRYPLIEVGERSKCVWTLKWYLKVPLKKKKSIFI